MVAVTCRVPECSKRHKTHYCPLCGLENSSHYSQNCPKGRILYHGTRLSNIKKISYKGLRPGGNGRLGPGVYFTDSLQVAEKISQNRGCGNGGAVFECMVNLGRIKFLRRNKGSMWQNEEFDSAQAIHPPCSGIATREFTEFCLKDARKCSIRSMTVTEGHDEGIGNLKVCIINKSQKEWKKLRQLDNKPKFEDVRVILNSHQNVSPKMPNQITTQQEWTKLRHSDNKPKFEDVRAILNNHQKFSPKIPNQFTAGFHHPKKTVTFDNRISVIPSFLPNSTLKVQYPDASVTCKHVVMFLKLILFLITFVIQVGSTVVQKHTCGFYSAAIITLILFICLLTFCRIVYCMFLVKLELSDSNYYIPFCCTLALVFFLEIPMMISNAFVVNSCGRVEAWTLSLHIGYIGHLWLALIMDSIYVKLNTEKCGFVKFVIRFMLIFMLPVVMYVPIYLKLGEKAYDFHLDIKKVGGDSTIFGRLVRNLLIHIGTIGWGFWCVGFLACVVGFFYGIYRCSRKLKVQYPDANVTCKHVVMFLKLILFLITFVIQVGSTVVQKHTCGFYSAAIITLILFICLLTFCRIVYCMFLVKLELSDSNYYIPFCCTLALVFFLEIPMMISNAFVVNSCGRVEAWTLSLHIGYIGHLWLALIMDSIYVKLNTEKCGFVKFVIRFMLIFMLPVVMYVPIYLKLGEKAYDFHLDIKKVGGDSTIFGRLVRNLLIHIGTIGWGFWCVGFLACVVGFFYGIYRCSRKCEQGYETV